MDTAGTLAKLTGSTNWMYRLHSSPRNAGTFSISIGSMPSVGVSRKSNLVSSGPFTVRRAAMLADSNARK